MPQRTFQVEAENPLPDGFWPGEPIEAQSRTELEALMLDAATVLDRIGGTFSIVAVRQQLTDAGGHPTDLYVTVGYRGKWESFAPAMRAQQPAGEPPIPPPPVPEPEADLTPEEMQEHFPEEAAAAEDDGEDDFGPDAEQALAVGAEG